MIERKQHRVEAVIVRRQKRRQKLKSIVTKMEKQSALTDGLRLLTVDSFDREGVLEDTRKRFVRFVPLA